MLWNWQRPEWPKFVWRPERLIAAEQAFIAGGGVSVGSVKHLGPEDKDELRVEAMSAEALTTSEIEGEILDRTSVQSSIRRQLGLAADKRKAKPGEQGVAEMMVDLHRRFEAPLSAEMLFGWQRMVTNGRRDLKDVGRYRRHADPMQVVSGPIHAPLVHFEAPPSAAVPVEMTRFVDGFNRTAPDGAEPLPALASRIFISSPSTLSRTATGASGAPWRKRRSPRLLADPRSSLWRRRSSPSARVITRRSNATTLRSRSPIGSPGSPPPRLKRNGAQTRSSTS